jgi:hypothetical protein
MYPSPHDTVIFVPRSTGNSVSVLTLIQSSGNPVQTEIVEVVIVFKTMGLPEELLKCATELKMKFD